MRIEENLNIKISNIIIISKLQFEHYISQPDVYFFSIQFV